MKVSDFIVDFLAKYGITHIFGYAGGAVTHLLDSIYKNRDMEFISFYHEQGAAFAAEGYARVKNDLGVALATSGPGATNLITGIGSAYFDSIPCLYITGQVNTYEYKGEMEIRQKGFQETDIVSIVTPITKYAVRVTEARRIRYELQKAIVLANSGRKGPVLLDIPMDIQRADIDPDSLITYEACSIQKHRNNEQDNAWLDEVVTILNHSLRPVILAGGGVRTAGASELLCEFAKNTSIPVVCSLMGLDTCNDECFYGLIGTYGNRYANYALANSDVVISVGSRLDSRQTGTDVSTFAREAKIVRVDIDERELQRQIKWDEFSLQMDAAEFLVRLNGAADSISLLDLAPWHDILVEYKKKYPSYASEGLTDPNYVMSNISEAIQGGTLICLDVGQNQMWAAQSLVLKQDQRLLVSGGMGAMGFSLPAAIGAYYAKPDRNIIAFAGDGGFQMNIQELQLIKRNKLPIKVIIMNNNALGMIRHFQEMYFEGRYGGTIHGYEAPDFSAVAQAYGIGAMDIKTNEDLLKIEKALSTNGPLLLCIHLPQITYVYPKLGVERPIEDQEPLLDRREFNNNMLIPTMEEKGSLEDYSLFIKKTFDRYKGKSRHRPLKTLPIYDEERRICAYLRPITQNYRISLPECSELLGKWRQENPSIATGTFQVTRERTEKWLDMHIIDREDRILFLIVGLDGQFLGHMGFSSFDYEKKTCEVDAVLRGVKGLYPGLMRYAMRSLINWGIHELHLDHITLKVFSDNSHAIRFYEKCGFEFAKLIPLAKVVRPGEEKWEICPWPQDTAPERYYAEMIYKGMDV